MIRISSAHIYNSPVDQMMSITKQTLATNEKLASGKIMLTPGDDPVGAAVVLQLDQEQSLRTQYGRNIDAAESKLQLEESTLDGIIDSLQRARELVLQANNASVNALDKNAILAEIRVLNDHIGDLVNKKDANGEYIFGGFQGDQVPFVIGPSGVYEYQGDEGQRALQVTTTLNIPISDSGKKLFLDVDSANISPILSNNKTNRANPAANITNPIITDSDKFNAAHPDRFIIEFNAEGAVAPRGPNFTIYRESDGRTVDGMINIPFGDGATIPFSGMQAQIIGIPSPGDTFMVDTSDKQSVMTTMAKIGDALKLYSDTPLGRDVLNKSMTEALANIDYAINSISSVQTEVGARRNTLDAISEIHADETLVAASVYSKVRDLDEAGYTKAVSQLSYETFVLQAAQSSFSRISGLSLFNSI